MLPTSASTLEIELKPSRLLQWYLALCLCLFMTAVFFLPLALVFETLLEIMLLLSALYLFNQHLLAGGRRFVQRLSIKDPQQTVLHYADGTEQQASLSDAQILFGNAVVLRFRIKRFHKTSIFVLPDNSGREERRQLRILLKQPVQNTNKLDIARN
ncbi:MAG: hypothetical protein KZQ58_03800 [gamma proteobacterium symbiont of Bathyaustriella thionipta]|nr:hypothetical protein [gamma proteobacterium symbiont of Bathyaustriella thionipta]